MRTMGIHTLMKMHARTFGAANHASGLIIMDGVVFLQAANGPASSDSGAYSRQASSVAGSTACGYIICHPYGE